VSRQEDDNQHEDGCAAVKMAMRAGIRMICCFQSTSRKFELGGDCWVIQTR
jgi:hypothetical protein